MKKKIRDKIKSLLIKVQGCGCCSSTDGLEEILKVVKEWILSKENKVEPGGVCNACGSSEFRCDCPAVDMNELIKELDLKGDGE